MKIDSDDAGDDGSWMVEFDVEREAPDGEHEEGNVRVHQPAENALPQGGGKLFDGLVGEVKGHASSRQSAE